MLIAHGNVDAQVTRKHHHEFVSADHVTLMLNGIKRSGNQVGSSFLK